MVEGRTGPTRRVVADGALLRKARLRMVRIRCAVIVRLMARFAGRRQSCVHIVRMARRALHARVHTRQRELGGAVVERCTRPGGRGVAGRTLLRQVCLHVVRIGCAIVVREMTRLAGRRQSRIHIA